LVYSSVVIGLALLIQLYSLVPTWLFYLVLVGWVVYLVVAIEAARGREIAYPSALIMSILTLVVSLPQPEHYSLATQGFTLAALTFIIGSAIQIATIISAAYYLFLRRRELGIQRKRQASPAKMDNVTRTPHIEETGNLRTPIIT
jgi:hypothetical protein